MCNPIMLLAASTTMQVAGSLQQGKAKQRQANEEAAQLEYQARVEQDNALAQAKAIRRAGERARGETLAGIVSAGVKVGEGSALDAERQVLQDTETDAAMSILNGERSARGMNQEASGRRQAGRAAKQASILDAVGTAFGAGAKAYKLGAFTSLDGYDAGGYNGTNDRSLLSLGNGFSKWARNGRSGD